MNSEFESRLTYYAELVNNELRRYFDSFRISENSLQSKVIDAMWYSISAGGKRIRPVLVMEYNRMCGGEERKALSCACAIEMIHTFSLIHDDLPCMDDDDFRRGRPSCHKQFGEAVALLAGDALENHSFEIICKDNNISADIKVKAMSILSKNVGISGMIGGQAIDISNSVDISREDIKKMYLLKTGALLSASCEMGCITAGADDRLLAARMYAENLGVAFQIIDDILDIMGESEKLGKPVGSDKKHNKNTYAELAGVKNAAEYAEKYTNKAIESLSDFEDCGFMIELTKKMLTRKK